MTFCSSLHNITAFTWVYGHLGFLFFPLWFHIGSWLSVFPFTISSLFMGIWVFGIPVLPFTVPYRVITFCSSLYSFIKGHDFLFFPSQYHCIHMGIWAFGIPVLPFMVSYRVMTFFFSLRCSSWVYGLLGFLFFPLWFHIGLWLYSSFYSFI